MIYQIFVVYNFIPLCHILQEYSQNVQFDQHIFTRAYRISEIDLPNPKLVVRAENTSITPPMM